MVSIIFLAIIQAITEFVPVSSSGHLIAASEVFKFENSLAVDVALHFGTLLALITYYYTRIKDMLQHIGKNKQLIIQLVLTSIPAAMFGFMYADSFEEAVRTLPIVITMLAVIGVVMILSESPLFKPNKQMKKVEHLGFMNALMVGFGQALALIPGTSRSGITMLSAKKAGLSNKLAAEYAFLAGIPVIAGASIKVFLDPDSNRQLTDNFAETAIGILIAYTFGLFALKFLIRYVSEKGLRAFGWYRLALAAFLFIIWINQ